MPPNTSKSVTLLSLNSRREPQKHQFYKGFKNVAYLAGYVYEIRANTIFLQMTNNINLVLPVTIPAGVKMPNNFRKHEAIKMVCQVRSYKEADGNFSVRVYARSFERPNVLELPLRSAFDKVVPERAIEDRQFKPYGAGYRQTDACNQVHLAGMVVATNQRSVSISEEGDMIQSAAVDFLLRQDDDENNVVPVRYYGKLADQIASKIRPGELILVSGKYRVKPIEVGEGENGKADVIARPYIHIDPPQQPTEFEIFCMAENQHFPKWMIDLHSKFRLGQRRVPKKAEVVASETSVAANSDVASRPEYEAHPKWDSLSDGDKQACHDSPDARRILLA